MPRRLAQTNLRRIILEELDALADETPVLAPRRMSNAELGRRVAAESNKVLLAKPSKNGAARVAPADFNVVLTDDQIKDTFRDLGMEIVDEVNPGGSKSASSKFKTYILSDGAYEYRIVIASAGNRGQKFEKEVADEFTQLIDLGTTSDRVLSLLAEIGVDPKEVVSANQTGGGTQVRRSLASCLADVGKDIADITVKTRDGQTHYISLKNERGKTFSNSGYAGAFVERDGLIVPVPIGGNKKHLDDFVKQLGFSKQAIADGLNSYAASRKSVKAQKFEETLQIPKEFEELEEGSPRHKAIQEKLMCGLGFGYWYARADSKSPTGWKVYDLRTRTQAEDFFKTITSIMRSYPGRTKQASAIIEAIDGSGAERIYRVEIRNTRGGIVPNEIKISMRS
jgi:hypothetical protein